MVLPGKFKKGVSIVVWWSFAPLHCCRFGQHHVRRQNGKRTTGTIGIETSIVRHFHRYRHGEIGCMKTLANRVPMAAATGQTASRTCYRSMCVSLVWINAYIHGSGRYVPFLLTQKGRIKDRCKKCCPF